MDFSGVREGVAHFYHGGAVSGKEREPFLVVLGESGVIHLIDPVHCLADVPHRLLVAVPPRVLLPVLLEVPGDPREPVDGVVLGGWRRRSLVVVGLKPRRDGLPLLVRRLALEGPLDNLEDGLAVLALRRRPLWVLRGDQEAECLFILVN